ncbi:MAG: NblA/ycf18 family protein [Pleurocapsa sp. MO_226.B13]|nr:NblA/ycf18 family protein [Pleurocapsa sp. MO_226.B13]
MESLDNSLSLEQEFNHRSFSDRVKQLTREEAQELLIQMHKQMLYKDNIYKELILSQEKDIVDMLFGATK